MDVVILAGGNCPPDLAEKTGVLMRACLPYRGKTMVRIVGDAVHDVGRVIVVGESDGMDVRTVAAGGTFVESLRNGIDVVDTESFLMATSDLPFLTAESVADFVKRCDPSMSLNYPIIRAEDCERQYPGMKRTTVRLREGTFTGGNIALVNTAMMRTMLPRLEQAYVLRKKPLKLAQMVGLRVLLRLLIGRALPRTLTIRSLEASVGRAIGGSVKGIVTPFPEIGADIDDSAQYLAINP